MSAFRFWLFWVIANASAELVGLGAVAAGVYGFVYAFGQPAGSAEALRFAALVVILGAMEGAIVGWAQHTVLTTRLPALRFWIVATTVGALLAWVLGMLPSALAPHDSGAEPPAVTGLAPLVEVLFACSLGAIAGLVLSSAQWVVLRRFVRRAHWWLVGNALAWAVGMPLIFALAGSAPVSARPAVAVLVVVAGLAATGALVGAIHGAFLVWLLRALKGQEIAGQHVPWEDP